MKLRKKIGEARKMERERGGTRGGNMRYWVSWNFISPIGKENRTTGERIWWMKI
jgi:hypothetical protein